MSNRNAKRVRKLKKTHTWIWLIVFSVFIVISCVLVSFFTSVYTSSFVNDRIDQVVPWLDTLNCGIFGKVSGVDEGWKHVDLGAGNHLFLRDDIYDKVSPKFKGMRPPEIYQAWRDAVAEIVLDEE